MAGLGPNNDFAPSGDLRADLAFLNDQVHLTVMLESAEAFRHRDEIVGMPGVDAVILGPSYLAQDLGVFGTPSQGRVIDEHRETFGRGDFLVRNVIGGDQEIGALAVNDTIEVGTTVQFHLRDAVCADEDLRELVAGRRAEAALLFTCNGRGTRLFRRPDHDAEVVSDALDDAPVAGFFAAGEFGPVGGYNFLHGFTASLALFGTDPGG